MRNLPLLENNLVWKLDSYKQLHDQMLPEGTEYVASYAEARDGSEYPYTVFFGLQYILIKHLEGVVVTKELIDQAEPYLIEHFKFNGLGVWNRAKWDYLVEKHGGKLPLHIRSVPEGTIVPKSNILFWVINTDPNCAWLTNAVETILQWAWYPTAVCTRSNYLVSAIKLYFKETVGEENQWLADFMLHDFGFRACTCFEQGGIGGMAHLVNSQGTDTDAAIPFAVNYYKAKKEGLCYSVPASEHSIATALGKDRQYEVTRNLCQKFSKGILSHVSDSYSIEDAVQEYCKEGPTKTAILSRDGKFVVRPDSPRWKGDLPKLQILWIAQELEKGFGTTINSKGYKELNPKVGEIYGDGLKVMEIIESLQLLKENGFAASTCVFGQGGGLLQKLNRDTIDFAIKCFAQTRNGVIYDISKSPMGGTKKSKKGYMKLVIGDGHLGLPQTVPISDPRKNLLQSTFRDGVLFNEITFEEVKNRAIVNPYLKFSPEIFRPI